MLLETLSLLSGVPALGLLWASTGSHTPLTAPRSQPPVANPSLREDDDDLDEDEEEEELEEELEEEELETEFEEPEEEEEEDDDEDEDQM
jgi:hypothetical protein